MDNVYKLQIQFIGDDETVEFLRSQYEKYLGLNWKHHNPFGLDIIMPHDNTIVGEYMSIHFCMRCRVFDSSNGSKKPFRVIPKLSLIETPFRTSLPEYLYSGCEDIIIHFDKFYGDETDILYKGVPYLQLVLPDLSTNFIIEFVDNFYESSGGITTTIPSYYRV